MKTCIIIFFLFITSCSTTTNGHKTTVNCETQNKQDLDIVIGTETNFAQRYYDLVDKFNKGTNNNYSLFNFIDYYEERNFTAKKHSKGNYISLRENTNPGWGLNISPSSSSLEVIFISPKASFTFHVLAFKTAKNNFPELMRHPPYPRVPVESEEKLYEVASEIEILYNSLKLALLKQC